MLWRKKFLLKLFLAELQEDQSGEGVDDRTTQRRRKRSQPGTNVIKLFTAAIYKSS